MRRGRPARSLQEKLESLANGYDWNIPDLLVAVWARKLRSAGHRITSKRRDQLRAIAECLVRGEDPAKLELASRRPLTLTIEREDLDEAIKLVEEVVSKAAEPTLRRAANEAAKHVLSEARAVAREARLVQADFERHLGRIWGRAFDYMRALVILCIEIGEARAARVHARPTRRERTLDDVLLRLHARGCLVASEVIVLLESGHAGGALARWRTLHEIDVVAAFIGSNGNAAARRYAAHADAEGVRVERAGQLDPETLDLRALLGARRARRLRKEGKEFEADYGWAAAALGKRRVTFKDLEEATQRATWRQPYAVACGIVHAGSHATHSPMGLLGIEAMLSGPTTAELEVPAEWTVKRLIQLTMTIIDREPSIDAMVATKVIDALGRKTLDAIGRAQTKFGAGGASV